MCFLTVQLKAAFHGWLPPTACIHDYLHALYMCRAFVHKVGVGAVGASCGEADRLRTLAAH